MRYNINGGGASCGNAVSTSLCKSYLYVAYNRSLAQNSAYVVFCAFVDGLVRNTRILLWYGYWKFSNGQGSE